MTTGTGLPCQTQPELFFAERPEVLAQAQELCRGCPIADLCLVGALERREPHGVWGGQIFFLGEVVPFKRGRGRPRKEHPGAA
ncbi:MAG TPA: WhiB family transcriptional regulator [Marmoricola sp.]|nr:WhiB family transcriptional regulator [Marmoricola sp.]